MKKKWFIFIFLFPLLSLAQNDPSLIFNEFGISLNKGLFLNEYDNNKIGYGIGLYRTGLYNKKTINVVFGLEYNSIKFYEDYIYAGHFGTYKDLNITIHSLTFPFLIRFNFGRKFKIKSDIGIRFDIRPWTNMKGIFDGYSYNESSGHLSHFTYNVDGPIAYDDYIYNDILPSVGLGCSYMFEKVELMFKTEFRYGLMRIHDELKNRYLNFGVYINMLAF